MTDATNRCLQLLETLDKNMNEIKERLTSGMASEKDTLRIESMLVEWHLTKRRWRPDIMGVTGPSGYDPQPVYEKCDTCSKYRLK
jgi:hypothetical protein